jgi:ribosomal protein L7/L12
MVTHPELDDRGKLEPAPDCWAVVLEEVEDRPRSMIETVKAVRGVLSCGLKEAYDIVKSAPTTVVYRQTETAAGEIAMALETAGALVRVEGIFEVAA